MPRGKRTKRGGGLPRPPAAGQQDPPEESQEPRPDRRAGHLPGRSGPADRDAVDYGDGGDMGRSGGRSSRKQYQADSPDSGDKWPLMPPPRASGYSNDSRSAGSNSSRRTSRRSRNERPCPASAPYSEKPTRKGSAPQPHNTPKSRSFYSEQHREKSQCREKSAQGNGRGYPYAQEKNVNGDYPLHDTEQEQYEEYQEQHYTQPQQHQFSSTHRQFNLAPIDVEMTSMKGKRGKRQNKKNDVRGRDRMDDAQQSYSYTGRYEYSQNGKGASNGNALEYNGKVLAYLDSESEGSSSSDSGEVSDKMGAGARRHEEFYNYADDDEELTDDDYDEDDDEERPLRRSRSSNRLRQMRRRPQQSVLSRSEQFLNRTLVVAFAIITFIFIRDHTPWWKEHERRAALQKRHHHHFLDGTDDDLDEKKIDPMAVYNTNDDDSIHTRDHDPLNRYEKYTKRDDESERHPSATSKGPEKDPPAKGQEKDQSAKIPDNDPSVEDPAQKSKDLSNTYYQTKAGERISSRPASKSLHHGFMDETYSSRPAAKNSESEAAVRVGKIGTSANDDVPTEAEKAAFLESVTRSADKTAETGSSLISPSIGTESVSSSGGNVLPPPPPQSSNIEDSAQASSGIIDSNSEEETDPRMNSGAIGGGLPAQPTATASQSIMAEATFSAPEFQGKVHLEEDDPVNKNTLYHDSLDNLGGETKPIQQQEDNPVNGSPEQYDSMDSLVEWGEQDDVDTTPSQVNINEAKSSQEQRQDAPQQSQEAKNPPESPAASSSQALDQPIFNQGPLTGEQIKAVYEDSYFRWNHPLRPIAPNDHGKDVPVFWRIPRSASGTIESVLSFCYRMVLANSMGTVQGHDRDEVLDIITVGTGARYVNVDMASPAGIQRAKGLNLGSSSLAEVIATPFLFETADIFKGVPETGKCFTLLRHPVDRAISLYHHYQLDESGNPNTSQYRGMTIDQFADEVQENNWMVRFLANKRSGSLTWRDLEAAKEVFGRKCLVGLVDKIEDSLMRYERFFGWDKKIPNVEAKNKCVRQYLDNGDKRKAHPTYEGTDAWEALRKKNEYDELLYQYATNLYAQQRTIYDKS